MLLAIDIGNTNITFGLFRGERLVSRWRCVTKKVGRLTGLQVNRLKRNMVDSIIAASVVPEIDRAMKRLLKKRFGVEPKFVTYKNAGIKIGYKRPWEVGADRLVDAISAWNKYKGACIVVDFGTATTLDYIDSKGVYWGGAIAPGIATANKALYQLTSKLPLARIEPVKRFLPRTTVEAIQIGIYQGYIGLIEHLIRETIKQAGGRPKIIATGGLSPLIAKGTKIFDAIDMDMTLRGLSGLGRSIFRFSS